MREEKKTAVDAAVFCVHSGAGQAPFFCFSETEKAEEKRPGKHRKTEKGEVYGYKDCGDSDYSGRPL